MKNSRKPKDLKIVLKPEKDEYNVFFIFRSFSAILQSVLNIKSIF